MATSSDRPSRGTAGSSSNFDRMIGVYGENGMTTTESKGQFATKFSARMAMNKLMLLVLVVFASGVAACFIKVPTFFVVVAMFAALGVGIWTSLRPQVAKKTAFIYSVLEGVVLGWFSNLMTAGNRGIVEIAIIGTAVIFFGVLAFYRTGLVKVTPRLVRTVGVATLGGVIAGFALVLFSWSIPSHSMLFVVVFGYIYLLLGTANLFVDFDYLNRAEEAGIDPDAEWYGAFMMLVSLVLVYMSLLRILQR